IGVPQFCVFVGTVLTTLATDLLVGIAAGIAIKLVFHLLQGVPLTRLFRARVESKPADPATPDPPAVLGVRHAAGFSTWMSVRSAARRLAADSPAVVIDLSDTRLVDHSVMEKLHELEAEFKRDGKKLEVVGLEQHTACSSHPFAARRRLRKATA